MIIIIDEQRSQKPTSLLAFPKCSAVAFLRGDLLCTDETIVTVKHVHVDQASLNNNNSLHAVAGNNQESSHPRGRGGCCRKFVPGFVNRIGDDKKVIPPPLPTDHPTYTLSLNYMNTVINNPSLRKAPSCRRK